MSAPTYFVAVLQKGEPPEGVNLTNRVLSFTFIDNERKVDTLRLTVDNNDLSNFDDPVWATGNILRFSFGYAESMSPIREAVIRKVVGGRQLTIEAHAKAVLMDKAQKRRRFDNVTRSEVVARVARENGFTNNLDLEETSERFDSITQANYTDAQFVRKLAHLEGFEFFVDFDGLHWHRRRVGQTPIRQLIYHNDPGRGSILDFDIENDITRKPGRVRVRSVDPVTGERIDVSSEDSTETQRDVLQEIPSIGVFNPETGSLMRLPGAPASSPGAVPQETGAQEVTRPSNVSSTADARREAKGRFIRTQQVAVKMALEIIGDPGILAKTVVEIVNMGRRLSGKYYVRAAEHDLSGSYTTRLSLITDGYQQTYKGGKGRGAPASTNLQSVLLDFRRAIQTVSDPNIIVSATVAADIVIPVVTDPTPALAKPAAQAVLSVVRAAQTKEETQLAAAGMALISALRSISDEDEQKTNGKLNKNKADDADKGALKAARLTGEDGILSFFDARGRD